MTVYGNGLGAPATYYCWEGGQVIADFRAGTSSNLVWEKSYVYLGGRLLATADISGTKYHHPDRLGTRLITETSGNVTPEQVNLPYGIALTTESSGAISNRRFTSYDRSATTGMDYAVNRFYNSAQGRFNQVDPIGMGAVSLSNPQSLNLYGYCENDPINHVDPYGLFLGKLFGWIGGVIKKVAKVFAVVLAVAAVLAFSWGFAAIGIQALIGAGIFAAIGWGSGKLSEFAGAFLGTLGKGGNFRTPPINGGAASGGINGFLAAQGKGQPAVTETIFINGQLYGVFKTIDDAAINAIEAAQPVTQRQKVEYGGRICKLNNGKGYVITSRTDNIKDTVEPGQCPGQAYQPVAEWHTHPKLKGYDYENFSNMYDPVAKKYVGDIPRARSWTTPMPMYLGTPSRTIKVYEPGLGSNGTGRIRIVK